MHELSLGKSAGFEAGTSGSRSMGSSRGFATNLKWTPPKLPKIIKRVDGEKNKVALREVKKIGLSKFLKKEKVFSYSITSPQTLIYTSFGSGTKSPINK